MSRRWRILAAATLTLGVIIVLSLESNNYFSQSVLHRPLSGGVQHVIHDVMITSQTDGCRDTSNVDLTPRFVCRKHEKCAGYKIAENCVTLFTTMTYRPQKLPSFYRTIDLWPLLGPEVTPVLYLAPSSDRQSTDFAENLTKLADNACRKGWDVLIAPHCNRYNYPVLSSMFRLVQQQYNSRWYGYSNADILFTDTFLQSLQFLDRQRRLNTHVDLVVGKRHDTVVCMTFQVNIILQ